MQGQNNSYIIIYNIKMLLGEVFSYFKSYLINWTEMVLTFTEH